MVLIQSVSPFLLQKLRRKYPPPQPPTQPANWGTADSPEWKEEVNGADPDYLAAREKWTHEMEERMRQITISLGAMIEWNDKKRAKLARLREGLRKAGEEDLLGTEGDDDFAYISYIACRDPDGEDYKYLLREIMNGSRPTEGAIQDAIATFRPEPNGHGTDIQGPEHIRDMGSS